MSPRKGTPFEEETKDAHGFQWTSNSGAVFGDADLRHSNGRFIVECKDDRRNEHVSISAKDLLKMAQQARTFGDGNWVRFVRRKNGKVVVSMNDDLFSKMLSVCDSKIVCPECSTRIQPDW